MERNTGIIILASLLVLFLLVWAPWMDSRELHDRVLREKGRIDGTIQPTENIRGSEEVLQALREESMRMGISDGILICDYNVMWVPFGRWVASCEGGWYVTFYGRIMP
jgi:hypothetical protein